MRAVLSVLVIAVIVAGAAWLSIADAPQVGGPVRIAFDAAPVTAVGSVWAISFVRARPGQRERLERFLKSNWLSLDEQALQQKKIKAFRMLRADADAKGGTWDYAVVIEYADRQAMADFVPFYLALARERPHVRIDGLDFADLGEVVQQKVVESVEASGESADPVAAQPQ